MCSSASSRLHRRIQGFPTIKAWVNGKAAGEYGGDRSASAIKDWALRLLPDRVATVNKQSQVRLSARRKSCWVNIVFQVRFVYNADYHVGLVFLIDKAQYAFVSVSHLALC